MKKTLKLLFIFTVTSIITLSLSLLTAAKVYTGTDGNIAWTVDLNTSCMKISGEGAIADFVNYEDAPYSKFIPVITTLVVEEGITSVGSCAFMYGTNLETVYLPDSLLSIGDSAFEFCSKLKRINIPSKVTSIGRAAFSSCRELDGIVLPNTLINLGEYAFSECVLLTSINIPESLSVIQNGVFTGCRSLTNVTGIDKVYAIGNGAFYGCKSLRLEKFPTSVREIAPRAFFGCSLLECVIPEGAGFTEGAFFGTEIHFNVTWDISGREEISTVKQGDTPQYEGIPEKDCVADGIYLFEGWNSPLLPATTPVNKYCAVYSLANPITSASYTSDSTSASVDAQLDLSGISCQQAYILFAAYTEDGHMISCKRVKADKTQTDACAVLPLRNRNLSYIKVFIYADPSYITPLGNSVTIKN